MAARANRKRKRRAEADRGPRTPNRTSTGSAAASPPVVLPNVPLDGSRGRVARAVTVAVYALIVANALFVIHLFWNHLNYVQIDHSGHIASGVAFGRGEYHEFSDQAFLGYVHGLFYPPLQDVVLAGLNWLTGERYVLAYQMYLSLLVIAYLAAIVRLARWFRSDGARMFLLVGALFLLNVEKPQLLEYQGLSFVDLWLTGLSSEVLGMVFLLLLVREWLGDARTPWLCGLLALVLLSHIVIGLVALLLFGLAWLQERKRETAIVIAGALGLSAVFWIPFVVNRSVITASNIVMTNPVHFAAAAAVGLWLGIRHTKVRLLFVVALLLLAPLLVGPLLSDAGIAYPKFHYYRFGIIALFLVVFGYALLIGDSREMAPWRRRLVLASVAGLCVAALVQFRFQRYSFRWPSLTPSDVSVADAAALETPEYGRFWVIGDGRSADFGIDALLSAMHPNFRSTKGLFWESYRHNTLLSSWYATLLAPPVVLDYFYFYGYDCEVNACLFDHFVHDYNVTGWIVDERLPLHYVSPQRRSCYQEILNNGGTSSYDLIRRGTVSDAARTYTVFWLADKGGRLSNTVLEPVAAPQLMPFDPTMDGYFADGIKSVFQTCTNGGPERTFIVKDDLAALRAKAPTLERAAPSNAKFSFAKLDRTSFELVVDAPEPVLFRIKLAYLPGVELEGENGPIPLYEGLSGMLAYGRGKMVLRYRRPSGVAVGVGTSLISAALLVGLWFRRRRVGGVVTTAHS